MSNQWFRMYSEFSHDPKVQTMSEAMQRRYIMIMCLRCSNNLVTLLDNDIAFYLRISEQELAETKSLFIKKGFVDSEWNLLNWEKRQFASDTSNARVAKHRALQKEKQGKEGNGDVALPKRKSNAVEQNRTEQNRTEQTREGCAHPQPPNCEKETNELPAHPSMSTAVCLALKSIGMGQVNPGNQELKNLIEAGADIGLFVEVGRNCVANGKSFAYLLATVRGRMGDAQRLATKSITTSSEAIPRIHNYNARTELLKGAAAAIYEG
jgi:hypothetical protein